MKKELNRSTLTTFYLIASAAWRLLPHWPNIAPFTALALVTGSQHQSRWAPLAPLIPLAATDLFFGLHATIPFVYGSMVLISLFGRRLRKKNPLALAGASLVSSLIFFVTTNFGVWLLSGLYPQTVGGLLTTFTLAIPFYQNALLSDLTFSLVFFGCMRLVEIKNKCKISKLNIIDSVGIDK